MIYDFPAIGRRGLLGLATTAVLAAGFATAAGAQTGGAQTGGAQTVGAGTVGAQTAGRQTAGAQAASASGAIAPIQRLDEALLAAMRTGSGMTFEQRAATLAPAIEQTLDLDAILAASVGLRWPSLPDDQKAQLSAAFRRYTAASYAANFDSYTGQTFQVSPETRAVGNGEVVVRTSLVSPSGSSTPLDYVMRDGPTGWKAVDVLAGGAISRVAVQRSDFRGLLTNGGVPALMAALQSKVASLSGGMRA